MGRRWQPFHKLRGGYCRLSCLVTLELIKNSIIQNVAEVGEYTLDALSEIQVRHPSIGQVRGKGLMIGFEFVEDRQTRKPTYNLRDLVLEKVFQHGLLTLGCGESAIRISPPLNISRGLIDEGLEILESAINDTEEEGLE